MSKYIKKFETLAQYTAAESSLILPNVSLVTENNTVHYNPIQPTPPTPSHDYVEIGGIKWATMNVGANSITDTGLYFQWGDTQGYTIDQVGEGEGKKYFCSDDYIYSAYTKYNDEDGLTVLQPSDDAVTAAWGGNWRMPTDEELYTLIINTTSAWTTNYEGSGVAGVVLTSKNDSSKELFFPTNGYCSCGEADYFDECYYWSSSLSETDSAYYLMCSMGRSRVQASERITGYSIRGILDE